MNPTANARSKTHRKIRTRTWWAALCLLLLAAFGLRVWRLTDIPPGLTHDEASNGHDSAAILRGVHRLYFPVGYGHEPLYNYSVALTTLFLGQSIFTLRITTVFWAMAQTALTVALARRWWGRAGALGTAAAYTASFWALMMARVGLRAPALPALLVASALAYDHAASATGAALTRQTARASKAPTRGAWRGFAIAGALLGASFYTYMASRGMVLLYPVTLLGLAALDRERFKRLWPGTTVAVTTALLTGLPLFLYLRAHPELEQRIAQLGSAITALGAGDPRPLWENVTASLPMLIWRGDPRWLYHIGERPALEPLLALLFLTGLGAAVVMLLRRAADREPPDAAADGTRTTRRRALLMLVWLAGGLAPALLAPVAYNTLHAIAAMPPVFLMVGLGFDVLRRAARRGPRQRPSLWTPALRTLLSAASAAALALTTVRTGRAYFVTWAQNRDVRVAYHHHVVALARRLDAAGATSPVVITSLYPGEFHDPYTMEVALRREDLTLRWADGRRALFIPQQPARLFVEAQTAPPAALWEIAADDVEQETALTFRPEDLPPWTRGYRWDAAQSWGRLQAGLTTRGLVQDGDPPPAAPHDEVAAPLHYGAEVELVGYRLIPDRPSPGETLTVLTAWRVLAPTAEELVLFSHLLNAEGTLIAQDDRLDAPNWQWRAGDRFVQLHEVALPPDAAADGLYVALGWYARRDMTRLPVRRSGETEPTAATRILLPVTVTAP